MNIATYDQILNTLPDGDVCRGDQDGVELISELWHALWQNVISINQDAFEIGEKWESHDYYNEVLSEIYWRTMEPGYPDDEEQIMLDMDTLKESLDDLSPVGHYFGGHPDDAWRLGVWPEWRNAE